jgi:hypothetical protein
VRSLAGAGELVQLERLAEADNRRMTTDGATQTELNRCAERVIEMKLSITRSETDAGLAGKSAALAWSQHGDSSLTRALQVIITEAMETGYARALSDIQDGSLDGEIAAWRPLHSNQ